MANPRELDKRRKSIKNIRKITRTMELIATARFRKAMDRASAATAYTEQIMKLVKDLVSSGVSVEHPLLEPRSEVNNAALLVLSANRGFCGGFNGNVTRAGLNHLKSMKQEAEHVRVEVSGKRGISGFKQGRVEVDHQFTNFEDRPAYDDVELIANRYLAEYASGMLDRLDVVYTRFESAAKQHVTIETLLPLGGLGLGDAEPADASTTVYEFLPSPESILEEVVPTSFRVKLFKCFLDTAVSEQIARMVAMKGATENAGDLIKQLSMQYNRARQGRITSELMDLIGGVEALS
ncbi:ATP synthase F1 subunit gamma [Aeoliella sp. ICT_H6.2]|uniref:ATP synthase gamma chain n=1 Tax=Aeoliella straminimaris TaxID=2954799 RepID=A0A9X2FJZ5_9BACT|nr:ATP synthase F1 subunit gamma [Aeoliella straminimaris]MCO6048151.1 ATP synthase F1 subunit gamma [Aeoliella straminimaris]